MDITPLNVNPNMTILELFETMEQFGAGSVALKMGAEDREFAIVAIFAMNANKIYNLLEKAIEEAESD